MNFEAFMRDDSDHMLCQTIGENKYSLHIAKVSEWEIHISTAIPSLALSSRPEPLFFLALTRMHPLNLSHSPSL